MTKLPTDENGNPREYLTGARRREIVQICSLLQMKWMQHLDLTLSELLWCILNEAEHTLADDPDDIPLTDETFKEIIQSYKGDK